jgi:UDP-N-acetylglucosamine 2-epimerase
MTARVAKTKVVSIVGTRPEIIKLSEVFEPAFTR